MSTRGIEGDPFAAGELPHDELIELARILNAHVAGYRDGGARTVAAAIMRAGYRKQADTVAGDVPGRAEWVEAIRRESDGYRAAGDVCKWANAKEYGPCSDERPEWDIVYPPRVGKADIEGPFCFQHALLFRDRAERADAMTVPEMVKRAPAGDTIKSRPSDARTRY